MVKRGKVGCDPKQVPKQDPKQVPKQVPKQKKLGVAAGIGYSVPRAMPREKLGEILIRAGYLTEDGLQVALNEQQRWGGQLGRYLVELGLISEEILVRALSAQYKVTAVALDPHRLDLRTARLVPQEICERNNLICFRMDPEKKFVDIAMSDLSNLDAVDEVRVATKCNVRPYIAAPTAIDRAISFVFYNDVSTNVGGEIDLSPESDLRADRSSELLRRAQGKPPRQVGRSSTPSATEMPALDLKVSISPSADAPPPPPVARPQMQSVSLPTPIQEGSRESIELPSPVRDEGFHITMDVPAVDKELLAQKTVEAVLAQLDAMVTRNSAIIKALLEALARKGLFTKDEIRRILS